MSLRTVPPSPRGPAPVLCPARVVFPLALGHVGNDRVSLSDILLIAVMSPFGVGPEAAAAADAAVEEEEDVDETVAHFAPILSGAMKWGCCDAPGPV